MPPKHVVPFSGIGDDYGVKLLIRIDRTRSQEKEF
jgi:hypothetical protein